MIGYYSQQQRFQLDNEGFGAGKKAFWEVAICSLDNYGHTQADMGQIARHYHGDLRTNMGWLAGLWEYGQISGATDRMIVL